ncbi:DeoR/GlpR transcriptional regulator [Actinobacillus succinogenes]|uniref:Transcriptional regulator, DeoR family n=1 Tax=Actinobacillus succinogenes (strain ATCC 55618 / DSM 22257 / CCUG 43843 / 130Z) TaxID=339671 RepID=A6VKK7_ACTSZ|nr:DeoR/GlpR family DNA-binding transcription regulator [Actinobacillus succinogenes]ABR73504.1 transcriptional regulator, DeoR family [Actinobacillus succinogenes 130Z]PHI40032.1 DeoR/GlpR transcriptional regulator [Actinobacillus succinogenes]
MIPVERLRIELELIRKHGVISISALMEKLNVSHMTIRRDIQKLESEGKVISVSGGVQLLERLTVELPHDDKSRLSHEQKEKIGKAAANLIPENCVVYLDAGTTTLEIAKYITEREDLLLVTNDFVIANYLMVNGKCRLIHIGGTVNKANRSSVGELAAQALRQLSIDLAFISTSSWNLAGLTTPDEDKISVKRAIIQASRRKVLVSDSSKYGKVATFSLFPLTTFNRIICDKGLVINAQEKIHKMDVELSLV